MISKEEILMNREIDYPLSIEQKGNLKNLLTALNKFRVAYGKPMTVSSGYRPAAINATVKGAAKKSAHMECMACDFVDKDGALDAFCLKNLALLADIGLWLESPDRTPGWCHLDIRPRKNRVFIP